MAPSSSSTKKAARLAQKGKGKRVRFQGGTLFPLVVAIVLVLGARRSSSTPGRRDPDADTSPPQPGIDHWHGAYGFQLCTDEPNVMLSGNLEAVDSNGVLVNQDFRNTGVHSHDDGVIHWHPYGVQASGDRAQLGMFLDNYGVDLSNTKLELPEGGLQYEDTGAPVADDFPLVYEEGETECDGEDAELKVVVWTDYQDPDSNQQYTSNFDEIPFDRDGLVIVIAFVPNDVDVVMPPWAANLPALGAADTATPPNDSGVPVTASTEPRPPATRPARATDPEAPPRRRAPRRTHRRRRRAPPSERRPRERQRAGRRWGPGRSPQSAH